MAAEQNDDKSVEIDSIPSIVQHTTDNKSVPVPVENTTDVSETSAIANNNNESIANNIKETKTNGNVVGVNTAGVTGKNKKKNKKGKSGASNENGINKDEIGECEVQGDTAVQV